VKDLGLGAMTTFLSSNAVRKGRPVELSNLNARIWKETSNDLEGFGSVVLK